MTISKQSQCWRALGCVLALTALLAMPWAQAAPVGAEMARTFAGNWLAAAGNALNSRLSGKSPAKGATPIKNEAGRTLAYVIGLEPTGFVVIAAEDRLSPLVMFSGEGKFSFEAKHPALAMLQQDLTSRFAALEQLYQTATRGAAMPQGIQDNQRLWQNFTEVTRAGTQDVVSEMYVDALIQSKWSQGDGIYNYYTPMIYDSSYSFDHPGDKNNAVSGCVATMTAQIIRYFQWPQKAIGKKTGSCTITYKNEYVEPKEIKLQGVYLRGGDGKGGAYRWDMMPLSPSGEEAPEALAQIGALLFDAGLSVGMNYSDCGSSSSANAEKLKSIFGYAGAKGGDNLEVARASLDARRPCALSIMSALGKMGEDHAVVLDGYGRLHGRWYYHLNMGWGGSADGWYNFEEAWLGHNPWKPGVTVNYMNVYRQKLQANDNLEGQIISGRVTDANGNPVAGVKVSLKKNGSLHQTMIAWYDPKNPADKYRDFNGVVPGAEAFRNTTDEHGIWAIDKVAGGTYEIVLEKDDLKFQGVKNVTVNSANQWGLNFVATPEEPLTLEAWQTLDKVVYLQFNRPVGNVIADLTKVKLGSTALTGGHVRINSASNVVAIVFAGTVPTGSLTMEPDFLVIDTDGQSVSNQEGVNNAPVSKVAPKISGQASGTVAAPKVTAITRDGAALNTVGPELTFKVTGTLDGVELADFRVRREVSYQEGSTKYPEKQAVVLPEATIASWDAGTGTLTVNVGQGDGFVRVDYLPAEGTPFLTGEAYHVDNVAPAMVKAVISEDNKTVTITWNEPVFAADGTSAVTANDLDLRLHTNNGTVINARVTNVASSSDKKTLTATIKYTPDLEQDVTFNPTSVANLEQATSEQLKTLRVPAGVETIEVLPYADCVRDQLGNFVPETTTTGELPLSDTKRPNLVSAVIGYDNYSLLLTFSERIYANNMGILNFNQQIGEIVERNISKDIFKIAVKKQGGTYSSNLSSVYRVMMEGEEDHRQGVRTIFLIFNGDADRKLIDPSAFNDSANDRPVALRLTIEANKIYGQRGNGNRKIEIEIPLHHNYQVGYARGDKANAAMLPPPMFSNFGKGSDNTNVYTQIELTDAQKALCVTYQTDTAPARKLTTTLPNKAEQGVAKGEGIKYYGVWYRDLDGDGRIDAVDLNFKNPYVQDVATGKYAKLEVGNSVISGFSVWMQTDDPEDYDDAAANLFAPASEMNWNHFPASDGPKKDKTNREAYLNFVSNWNNNGNWKKFALNWRKVSVTGHDLYPNRKQNYAYTTLRLRLDQSQVPLRTHGDRFVMVTYTAPRYYKHNEGIKGTVDSDCYDGRIYGDKAPLAAVSGTTDPNKTNPPNTSFPIIDFNSTEAGRWSNADEDAGLLWRYSRSNLGTDKHEGHVDAYFMVDSFGPVFAWDGAAPAPVTATAWRQSSFIRNGEENFNAYDTLDIRFSEPIAYAADKALGMLFGYDDSSAGALMTPAGVLHGAWGAEVLEDGYTVRYKANGVKFTTRDFSFYGALYGLSGGFNETYADERKESAVTAYRDTRAFHGKAIGVQPIDARYRVLAQGDVVPMLRVIDDDASITTNRARNGAQAMGGQGGSVTMELCASKVWLKTVAQGGGFTNQTAQWCRDGNSLGNATAEVVDGNRLRGTTEYGMKANALSASNRPGSAVYGGIGKVEVVNNRQANYEKGKFNVSASGEMQAPDPVEWGLAYSTFATPARTMLSGPVYNMVKVSPYPGTRGTSRICANAKVKVLGIDIAGASTYKLTQVVVRAYDMAQGQFDPAIDFKPLEDGQNSGVQLLDAGGNVVLISNDGLEWSEWRTNEAGQMYREVTMRLLKPEALPTKGGDAQSFNFTVQVYTSENFNLGDSFIVEIPDDGITIGNFSTVDKHAATWGTANGTRGFPFTDFRYRDSNLDGRWAAGDAITSTEELSSIFPLYDGGRPYFNQQNMPLLNQKGVNLRNLYYAKKRGATRPEVSPIHGIANFSSYYKNLLNASVSVPVIGNQKVFDILGIDFLGTTKDLDYNVRYVPGDDVWYDIGGELGVYDEGIDIPLFGNANAFPLPWQISEAGAQSEHFRAAAPATAGSALAQNSIAAPSGQPVAVVGVDMQDAGAGFGPRYVLNGSILIETMSKNAVYGNSVLNFNSAAQTLTWNDGEAVAAPAEVGGRAVVRGADGAFMVVRRLTAALPAADTKVDMVVSSNDDRDIQQPTAISGVRILGVGRGNETGTFALTRSGSYLSWKGGPAVDVAKGGHFILNPGRDDYLKIQVTQVGGAVSENLAVYESEGRSIMPFLNITGLEIMAVSDMVRQGFYSFGYDGAGALAWGTGAPVNVRQLKENDLAIIYGDGASEDYPHNYIVVRRGGGSLPTEAKTDSLFVNQTQLFKVDVTLTNVSGVTPTHFAPMANDETSGISLWWDANADGKFNLGDMFVPLLETPVLTGGGDSYTCTLRPDPQFLTAWLSSPQNTSTRGHNFFVCVQTTVDMSYGDQFRVSANFYEPTEPDYETGGNCFASGNSGKITCTSITNTILAKMTSKGQSVDAGTMVDMVSIDHFLGQNPDSHDVYITSVKVNVHGVDNFEPEKVFQAMDDASPAKRGIVLKTRAGKVIPCHVVITADPEHKLWTYELLPEVSAGDSLVPETNDGNYDHVVAFNLSDELPFGVSFYVTMDERAVSYNTGVGSAVAVRTDTLTTTINSSYADLLGSSMVSTTTGVLINRIGSGVPSAYHNLVLAYNPNTHTYTLTWNGFSAELDMTVAGTYTLGEGDNAITVTFDPQAFFREDTIVNGRPPQTLTLGAKLTALAGQGLTYNDANANGRYDDGEAIAFAGNLVYGTGDVADCKAEFTAADGLAFFDEDENGAYTAGEAIFHDSDGLYTLPWMDHFLDTDNYVTPGQGAAPAISADAILVDVATISPAAATDVAAGNYLYYIDTVADGRGYVHGEDVIVVRQLTTAGAMPALDFTATTDKVVLDPVYDTLEDKSAYTAVASGTLVPFDTQDYVRFRRGGNDDAAYEQGEQLFLSVDNQYGAPSFTWTFRVDNSRVVRRYNPDAPVPFNEVTSALSPIIGLDLANSGATDVQLTSLTLRFYNDRGFTQSDLRALSTTQESGVQLWRDMDGNGIFNPGIDKLVELSAAPAWSNDGIASILTFSPKADNDILSEKVDGIYDFFVVILPDTTSNSLQAYNDDRGDQFHVEVRNSDVTLNKPLNKTATITTGIITIDSCPPAVEGEPVIVDKDKDGFIETIAISFNEKLRPGMLEDVTIWDIRDADTNNPVSVAKAELSPDYLTVTLTLAEASLGTTTGAQRLNVNYTLDSALLDWAGNPVDFTGISTGDTIAPIILHHQLALANAKLNLAAVAEANNLFYHDRNGNDQWDEGEDIWTANQSYTELKQRLWNGGDAWNTALGYAGKALANAKFSDDNQNGVFDLGEFLWLDLDGDGDCLADSGDIVIPMNRTEEIEVLDSDHDGIIDALRVSFSEALKDSTMTGYLSYADAFLAAKWSLEGRSNLKAWRQGLNDTTCKDAIDNNILYFSFDPATAPDSDLTPKLNLLAGETLADTAGNRLHGGAAVGNLLTTDQAQPVLVSVVSSERVSDAGVLPAGTTLTLTFSEPLVKYLDTANLMADFTLNGAPVSLGTVSVEHDGNVLVVTLQDETSTWNTSGVTLKVADKPDTIFGDAVGHNLWPATVPVDGIQAADPTAFTMPRPGQFLRQDNDALDIALHLGDGATAIAWSLELNGDVVASAATAPAANLVTLNNWRNEGIYAYTLKLTLTFADDKTSVTEAVFYAASDSDVFDAGEVIHDGDSIDTDQVLAAATELKANWSDFTVINGLPAAASYKLKFQENGYDFGAEVTVTGATAGTVSGVTLTEGNTYTACVQALDADGVLIATAYSDGAVAVSKLDDVAAPVIASAILSDQSGSAISGIATTTTLYTHWQATDDNAVSQFQYRVVKAATGARWSEDAGLMRAKRGEGFATTTLNGHVYAFGGFDGEKYLASAESYDVTSRTWTNASFSFQVPRSDFGFIKLADDRLVALGGDTATGATDTIEIFDGTAWQLAGTLPAALYASKAVKVADDTIWLIGGYDNEGNISSEIIEITLVDNVASCVSLGNLLTVPRYNFEATTQLRNGKLYVIVAGGYNPGNEVTSAIDSIDVATLACTTRNFVTARSHVAMVEVPKNDKNSDVWFIGGIAQDDSVLSTVERLTSDGIMDTVAGMNAARYDASVLWVPQAECILVAGGLDSASQGLATTEIAFANGTAWQNAASFTAAGRQGFQLVVAGQGDDARIVAFGGYSNGNYVSSTESRSVIEAVTPWTTRTVDPAAQSIDDTFKIDGLNLSVGEIYAVQLKAADEAGNWSVICETPALPVEVKPVAVVSSEQLAVDGISTTRTEFTFTVTGEGISHYRWQLNAGSWSEWLPVSDTIALSALDIQAYTLKVVGRTATGMEQAEAEATTRTWTVVDGTVVLTFTPNLPATGALATQTLVVAVNIKPFKYELLNEADEVIIAETTFDDPAGTPVFTLADLAMGSYKLRVWSQKDGVWNKDAATETTFAVALAEFAGFTPELALSSNDSYAVDIKLNGLVAAKYQLDDSAVVMLDEGATGFELNALAVGSHSLKLWGIDANGNSQTTPAEVAINVISDIPVGERLTAVITAPPTQAYDADGNGTADTLAFTVTLNSETMIPPVSGDFILEQGSVYSIVPDGTDPKVFTVNVMPILPEGDSATIVSLQLPANTLFHAVSGSGNAASNKATTTVYAKPMLAFTIDAVDAEDNELPAEGIHVNDIITVNVKATSEAALNGGEIKFFFDPAKFELAEDLTADDAAILAEPYVFFDKSKDFELLKTADDKVNGLRLVAVKKVDASAQVPGTVDVFSVKLKAIGVAEAKDDDLKLEAVPNSAFALTGFGLVKGDSTAVTYGSLAVAVAAQAIPVRNVTLSFNSSSTTENASATLWVNIGEAVEQDVEVLVKFSNSTSPELITVEAGETVQGHDLNFTPDGKLNGDAIVTAKIETVSYAGADATFTAMTEEISLIVKDIDAVGITLEASAETITEGESVTFTAKLRNAYGMQSVAGKETKLTFQLTGTTLEAGCYTVDQATIIISAGSSSGSVTVTTYNDDIDDDGRELVFAIDELIIDGAETILFAAPAPVTVAVANAAEAMTGDFNGDNVVNYKDILLFATYYGTTTTPASAIYDLNSDGVINYKDVLILATYYDDGTRADRMYASTRINPVLNIRLVETSGKTTFNVGETLTFELRLSSSVATSIKSGVAVLSFDDSVFEFTSEKTVKGIVDEDWRELGSGVEETPTGLQIRGVNFAGVSVEAEEEVTFARFTMRAKCAAAVASVSLEELEGTTSQGNTEDQTLDVIAVPAPTFSVADSAPAFTFAFEVTAQTRATEKMTLWLGTKDNASADFQAADGDVPVMPAGSEPYRLVSKAGALALVRDFRPVGEDTAWPLEITVKDGHELTLDWSLAYSGSDPDVTMPSYYNFYLDLGDGSEAIYLNNPALGAARSVTLQSGTYANASLRVVKAAYCKSLTLNLNAGWNLVGLPFAPDAISAAKLAALKPTTLIDDAYSAEPLTEFTAGQVFWLHVNSVQSLTVTGVSAAPAAGVSLRPGWNFVTPTSAANLARPGMTQVPLIWRWTSEGYRECLEGSVQELGRGYWIYAAEPTTIWAP